MTSISSSDLPLGRVGALASALGPEFEVDQSMLREALLQGSRANAFYLLWFRAGGEVSDRQWRDVLGVLIAQRGQLDEAYIDLWANQLGIADLLARARREAN